MNPLLFTDFDEYSSAIQEHVDLDVHLIHPPRADQRTWSIQQVALESLRLQFVEEGSGLLARGVMHRDGWGLYVQLSESPVSVNGEKFSPGEIVVLPPGAEFCFSAHGPVKWFSVFVPLSLLVNDVELSSRSSSVYVSRGSGPLFEQLQLQASIVCDCATKFGSSHLRSPDFALQQDDLLSSVLAILANDESHRSKVLTLNAKQLVSRAIELVQDHRDLRLSIRDLAANLDVSERTLQYAFRNQLQVSPQQFLINYRLQQAHRDLHGSQPEQVTVGSVATKHGFFDFGRFAAKYFQLYGELPSATLRRRK
jgi:AraC family transcriptional regulator, ethanolamine operon transcriptional activator